MKYIGFRNTLEGHIKLEGPFILPLTARDIQQQRLEYSTDLQRHSSVMTVVVMYKERMKQ